MKAMVHHSYGSPDALELVEIDRPAPEQHEVPVKVRAAAVNWHDWHFLTGTPLLARLMAGPLKPKNRVLGIDVAGTVAAMGADVARFQPGDEIFGAASHGCFAEYVSVSEETLVAKPAGVSFEEAAAVPASAIVALIALRDCGRIQPGQTVLINGASGGLGAFATQLAKSLGAEVVGVCSTGNVDLVRSLGADQVIDYTQTDFGRDGEQYDLIFDAVGKRRFADCRGALRPHGILVTSKFSPLLALEGLRTSLAGGKKLVPLLAKPPDKKDLVAVRDLLENGVLTPIIDRCYPLNELPAALQYLAKGHTQGKIVITLPATLT